MYVINEFLTAGAFGVICKGHLKNDKSNQVVIKFPLSCTQFQSFTEIKPYLFHCRQVSPEKLIINDAPFKDIVDFKREYNILSVLSKHPNILKLIDFKLYHIEGVDNVCKKIPLIITEYCEGGNLLNYLQTNDPLSEKECNYLFKQLISGLEFMHSLNIIHHDVKLENILLKRIPIQSSTETKSAYFLSRVATSLLSYLTQTQTVNESQDDPSIFSYRLKICDFGFARVGNENLNQYSGSPHYSAPEIYTKGNLSSAIDLWSAGVCLFAMATSKLPFSSSDTIVLKNLIIDGQYDKSILMSKVSASLQNLIENLLIVDPEKRFTISQIKDHQWYQWR